MQIFLPATILAIYTICFFFFLGLSRRNAVLKREVDPKFYKTYSEGKETDRLVILTRHSANLLETPILFYAVTVMIFAVGAATSVAIGLAWTYVGLRFIHAYIHLTSNFVLHRFLVFGAGMLVLLAMWVWLLVFVLIA